MIVDWHAHVYPLGPEERQDILGNNALKLLGRRAETEAGS